MYLLTERTELINRPVAIVYAHAVDLERFPEWFPGVLSICSADERAPDEVGKEYVETLRIPLRGLRKIRLQVMEARRDEFFASEGRFAPLLPRMEMRFRSREGACELTWRMYSRNPGLVARLTLLPLVSLLLRGRARQGLRRLRLQLESGAGVALADEGAV